MTARHDLIVRFSRVMRSRVAAATELWLGFEQGKSENLVTLRRLLHTVKGEAHMLDLSACGDLAELAESVVDALKNAPRPTRLTGDALLGALEGMGSLSTGESDPTAKLEPLVHQLRQAIAELEGRSQSIASSRPPAPVAASVAPPSSDAPFAVQAALLRPEDVGRLLHELRRLHSEQAVFHEQLREAQRMLRALLAEMDPRLSSEGLAERITKTLGYGADIDRRLTAIRNAWSGSDFTFGLALDELDATVRRASIVSVDNLLQQVVLVGRTTARTVGKEIDIRVGGDAILDAAIERRLEAALLHLVRNAIDHGIESSEMRRERGKPEKGTIQISIIQEQDEVKVTVEDDGGGVNFDKLRRVLEKSIPGVETMRNEELVPYLFKQGVTTTDRVTSISGRGVGLDVVAREVTLAGGQLRVDATGPQGTRIVLHLPATVRGEVAVPVMSGQQQFAIPVRAVHSVVRVNKLESGLDGEWIRVQMDSGAEVVRLHSLGALFGNGARPKLGEPAIVLYHASGLFALSVEGYDNPRPVVVQPSEELAFASPIVRGVVPSPDGGVLLLLDVEALYAASRTGVRSWSKPVDKSERTPRVLIVEDAPVARELLSGILRSLGLRVEEATDGRQGLMLAQQEPPDLILTDIEMPYMDGIEMLTELRRSPLLARVPVIVLSTAATKQNLAGLAALGVSAVLSKQKFVEAELRELVERCVKARG